MSAAIRVVDLSQGEYIEVPSTELTKHLLEVLADLEKERDETLDQIAKYVKNVDDLLVIFADYLGEKEARGTSALVHQLFGRLKNILNRYNRLFTISNSYANTPAVLVRLNMAQAKDFGY